MRPRFLTSIARKLKPTPKTPASVAEINERGVRLVRANTLVYEWKWNDVQRIRTYKADLFTIDAICFAIDVDIDGEHFIEVAEDTVENFKDVQAELECRYTFPEGWWRSVAFPAFKRNECTLWER